MRRNTTTWGMIAASGALVLTLAACGDDSPEVEEPETTSAEDTGSDEGAETEGTDEGTDTGEETEAADGGEQTEGGDTGGEAAAGEEIDPADFVAQLKSPGMENMTTFTMNMDMQVEGQAVTMAGKADLSGDAPAMDITMEMPGMGNIHMIMVDGSAYIAMPGLTEEGQFIQMPLEEVMGEDAEEFTNQVDMTSQWDEWEAGAQTVTFVGPEDVDGETLNKYELLLDTTAIETEDMAGMPSELTYNVWLDDQNFMRQVTFDLAGAETVMKMEGWGEPVDITAPTNVMEMPGGMPTSP
ncbi:hypothetical protein MWU75_08935 [Ornithinimicrobium sp. F0845]|uniref:DUF7537 family lipoprotein n=1 Tax=Ornithinimicrobium sp. F0845 TaxID=2926412 RepID=UPI001FF190A2|nr:hypothetical protein [Ornithinimicrobium sp. F0845]MCK0112260.1 hypothetical protein [Ornithinimicrobium sp. F0845]